MNKRTYESPCILVERIYTENSIAAHSIMVSPSTDSFTHEWEDTQEVNKDYTWQ
ncbi:hypothetical protein SAMN05421877_10649 [Sphingobacterium lactis]|uniref:Uncharacterized protein n=1 Tax=Sphingobacterium lactis TaxID=797291 RepID=A0A1H5YN53_9SPHI|nr:hypothetical protein SAMN05421877_10649 [Sphingobacterium lactis]